MLIEESQGLLEPPIGLVSLDHSVSVRSGREEHPHREPGPLAEVFECNRRLKTDRFSALFRGVPAYNMLWFGDFNIDNSVARVGAVGTMHHKSPDAARSDVDLLFWDNEGPMLTARPAMCLVIKDDDHPEGGPEPPDVFLFEIPGHFE